MEKKNESSPKSGGSSPDTVIGPSSSEEDDKDRCEQVKKEVTASAAYVTGIGESSSSLDTVIAASQHQQIHHKDQHPGSCDQASKIIVGSLSSNAIEEVGKKKGRLGALKNTLRKITKSKSRSIDSSEIYGNFEYRDAEGSKGFFLNQQFIELAVAFFDRFFSHSLDKNSWLGSQPSNLFLFLPVFEHFFLRPIFHSLFFQKVSRYLMISFFFFLIFFSLTEISLWRDVDRVGIDCAESVESFHSSFRRNFFSNSNEWEDLSRLRLGRISSFIYFSNYRV